jgi:exopolysaccharide biosynthesis polyprenyl glycosylphosphotransferase
MVEKEMLKRVNRNWKGIPPWMVAAVDLSLVNLSYYLSFTLRFLGRVPEFNLEPFAAMVPWVSIATVFLFNSLGLYSRQRNGLTPILRSVITGVVGVTVFSVVIAFWIRGFTFPRSVFLVVPVIQFTFMIAWRILLWRLELWIHGQKKLLVVGNPQEVRQALEKLLHLPRGLFEVVKVIEPDKRRELLQWLDRVDAVMLTGALKMEYKSFVIRESFDRGKEAFVVPDLYEILLTRASITQVHDTPVVEVRDMRLSFMQAITKRAVDLTLSFLILVPVLPLLALLWLAVKLTSPGPVIYMQKRVGYGGRVFNLYKFRTMIHNAEEESGPVLATENDTRVTLAGGFLRKTRLDELPQLLNVLKGDLSLVGPRPERPYFVQIFTRDIPEYALRHLVKPGLTGLAQVAGYYSTETRDKLRYDLYYISDYSLLLDFKILLSTVPTLFNFEAAAGIKHNGACGLAEKRRSGVVEGETVSASGRKT